MALGWHRWYAREAYAKHILGRVMLSLVGGLRVSSLGHLMCSPCAYIQIYIYIYDLYMYVCIHIYIYIHMYTLLYTVYISVYTLHIVYAFFAVWLT